MLDTAAAQFDDEDRAAASATWSVAYARLVEQAKQMDLPPSVAFAASFAEQVNARLPLLVRVRSLEPPPEDLAAFLEAKQLRLALQAAEMLRLALKETQDVGPV